MKTNPIRFVLSITIGVLVAYFVSYGIQQLLPSIMGYEPMTKDASPQAFIDFLNGMTLPTYIAYILSFIIGAYFGGYASARFAKERKAEAALAVGIFLSIMCVFFVIAFTHPLWVAMIICLGQVPFAYLGGRVGK